MRSFRKQNGITLIELIVVMVVLGIIALVITGIVGNQVSGFVRIFNRSTLSSQGQKAVDVLRRDLHNMSSDNIIIMQSDHLRFTDFDGNIIEYELSDNKLTRNDNQVANYVQNPPFIYLDQLKNVTSNTNNLCFVKVDLQFTKGSEILQLEEYIYVRN